MKSTITSLLGTALIFSATAFAGNAEIQQIESAYQIRDGVTLQALQTEAKTYDQAFAHYRLATVYYFNQKHEAKGIATLKASSEILEALHKAEPKDPEVMALLSGVYGMQIQMQPMKFMSLGRKASKLIANALILAPENPRVQYFYGVNRLNAPAMFGGSEKKALDAFDKAIELFEAGKGEGYQWGQTDSHIWKGIVLKRMGDMAAAKQSWQKALELNPDSRYAEDLLKKD